MKDAQSLERPARSAIRTKWRHAKVDLAGVPIHWITAGEGPLVVLLHGFPDYWYTWLYQIPVLAGAGYRVVVPDLRGYNVSGKPPGVRSYTLEKVAEDVAALVRHCGGGPAHIVGHDWGAVVAWRFAVAYPELTRSIVALSVPHPGAVIRSLWRPSQFARLWYQFFFQIPKLPEYLLLRNDCALLARIVRGGSATKTQAFTDEDLRRYRMAWRKPGAMTAMLNYYRALFRYSLFRGSGGKVRCPSMLLFGASERVFLRSVFESTRRFAPGVRIEEIDGASHWLHLDRADHVSNLLTQFLRGVDADPVTGAQAPSR